MKIGITCPVYIKNEEHIKYLNFTTGSIVSRDHDIYFIPVENYIDPSLVPISYGFTHEPLEILPMIGKTPQSVASGWNLGISRAADLDLDYVLVINTDIVFKSNAIDRLVVFAESQPASIWTASEYSDLALLEESPEDENFNEHPHFSCFMVQPKKFIEEFGLFDENFIPAYLEDGDAHARLSLADKKCYIYGGSKFYHFGSRTIKSDAEEWRKNTISFPKNQQYFLNKWGHPPVGDVAQMKEVYFKTPYNENKPLNYWRQDGTN
jgi:hypothetical protein